jgi:quercetin dioxygenase-like cupin family protein
MNAHTTQDRLFNPYQQDWVTFLETSASSGGERTLVEVELAPGGGTPLHYHDAFAEHFEAINGVLAVQVEKEIHHLQPGETMVAPIGSLHRFFNPTDERITLRVELRPGSTGFEFGLRISYGLAVDGGMNRAGVPKSLYHLALITELSETRLHGLLALLQPIFGWLARRARGKGIERELLERYCRGT